MSTDGQWYIFWTIQALDIYSTYRGLKYNCVRESNPLLGERPGIPRLVTHKTIFLYPYWVLQGEEIIPKEDMTLYNLWGTTVIHNNYVVWNRAKKVCRRL